jgi:integrase
MRGKITLTSVAALTPGETLHDVELQGFMVRRWNQSTAYSVRGHLGGQRLTVSIGRAGTFTPHMARKEATRILGLLAAGKDPRIDTGKVLIFSEAAEAFLAHVAARRSEGTTREYTGHLDDHLIPRFGRKPLAGVTTADLSKLHMDLHGRPVLANRILSTTSSLYGWAETQDLVPDLYNPARRVQRYPEESKERFLSIQELSKLGQALRELEKSGQWSPFALGAIRLLLFTGCRRNEIRMLQWPHVDWDRALINLKKAKRGKRVVYLNAGALAVLRTLRSFPDDGNPYIIRGVKDGEPYKNLQDVWQVVRERAGLTDVRIHDLRHSVASVAGADGASLPLIGALLGHQSAPATKRYLHLTGNPTRSLADRVGILISSALDADVDTT